eukprot:ANDGO_01101.mRNA.1 hypothetical protein CAOG_06123
MSIRLGVVPEHFSAPFYWSSSKNDADQQWTNSGEEARESLTISLVTVPGGSGKMRELLERNELDGAIMLTEAAFLPFVKTEATPSYNVDSVVVDSPLMWSLVQSGKDSSVTDLSDIFVENCKIGVSRFGSGSHVMAALLFRKHSKTRKPPTSSNFVVCNDLAGLLTGIQNGSIDVFFWEFSMLAPYVASGSLVRLRNPDPPAIDNVAEIDYMFPPPWPSFVLVTRQGISSEHRAFLITAVESACDTFFKLPETDIVAFISSSLRLDQCEVRKWLSRTRFSDGRADVGKLRDHVTSSLRDL